jgi:hypothetical protein
MDQLERAVCGTTPDGRGAHRTGRAHGSAEEVIGLLLEVIDGVVEEL